MAEKALTQPAHHGARSGPADRPRGLARLQTSPTLAFDPIPVRASSHAPASVDAAPDKRRSGIAWIAAVALPLAALWGLLRAAVPTSAAVAWDFVGRDPLSQQLTGFVAVGLFGLALMPSLLLRTGGRSGRREQKRALHVVFGVAICLALLIHTSARLGRGFNLVLSIAMLALLTLGAALGLLWRRVPPQPPIVGRGLRPLHVWFWWPALGLIATHVLAVYYF